ncbi:MAG: hypothetical protein ABI275_02620 [Terrimesophilobacter sp.]
MALAAAFALLLGGCAPQSEPVRPKPSPSASPIFASDDEALAAATKAYAAYLKVSDEITQTGGLHPEKISDFVTPEMLSQSLSQYVPYRERGLSSDGVSTFDAVSLQQVSNRRDGGADVDLYLCLDISGVKILDSAGADVTVTNRPDRLPLEVTLSSVGVDKKRLLVARSETWPGTSFC